MTIQVKEILDRVLTWPRERQEAAARVLTAMDEQDASLYRLTDEQVEEVERRLNSPDRKLTGVKAARDRFARGA